MKHDDLDVVILTEQVEMKTNQFHIRFIPVLLIGLMLAISSCRSNKSVSKNPSDTNHKTVSTQKKTQEKYAALLGVNATEITNIPLYEFIDDWYGTPYQYGGKTKKGIDCSGFAAELYKTIYNKDISGTSETIYEKCTTVSIKNLKEGDLLFFKIDKNRISHIGVYLQNNKFVHATTKKGVMIDDLDEAYYKKYFYKAGKLK